MARTVLYLFGRYNLDGASPIYDDPEDYTECLRLYFCDQEEDMPSDPQSKDLAINLDSHKLYFVKNGEWTSIKGEGN